MAPRVFQHETLPSGPPSWDVVKEILDDTAGDHPTAIRDHAILMLLAVHGVRSDLWRYPLQTRGNYRATGVKHFWKEVLAGTVNLLFSG